MHNVMFRVVVMQALLNVFFNVHQSRPDFLLSDDDLVVQCDHLVHHVDGLISALDDFAREIKTQPQLASHGNNMGGYSHV